MAGFVPPPYPYERLDALARLADALPGGLVDCSIGTPCDPVPDVAVQAAAAAVRTANGYPASAGSAALRDAARDWIERRFGVALPAAQVAACVGTKEFVATLPQLLHLRDPGRDTVLFPAIAYPTYEMGATLAGLRSVPVALDRNWNLDLSTVSEQDAERALLLWCNVPGNPTGAVAGADHFGEVTRWAARHGIVVASDECYVEFAPEPTTVLSAAVDGVLAVHSVSKRSNFAGARVGFYAGDGDLVHYLLETRKHMGMMVPAPMQAAAAAALADDEHVAVQRARYEERRTLMVEAFAAHDLLHDGGPMAFYLWLRTGDGTEDGWEIAARLAHAGTLVSPGDLYGPAGADHVRVALVQPLERLRLAVERLAAAPT